MKIITKPIYIVIVVLLLAMFMTNISYSYPGGIAGRTKKNTTSGCSCHGSTSDPTVTVNFVGPDSIAPGQTVTYTLFITKSGKTGSGLDIASRNGLLNPVSSTIKLMSGEIVHKNNISMTSGSMSVQFSYTAPNANGIDTLWATGLATNSDNGTDGDVWNWSQAKRIVISNLLGIKTISNNTPAQFSLGQNFPNPFNPSTIIKFAIPVSGQVKLSIIDLSGKEVKVLVDNELKSGNYEYEFNASSLSSGVYIYRLTSGDYTGTGKMVLVK